MRFAKHEAADSGIDLTPMIDVTFQLIAFFMFVLNFSQVEQDQSINLPASELAKPSEEGFEKPLTVQMLRDGSVLFAGNSMPLASLETELRNEATVLRRLKEDPAEVTIIIRADGDAVTGRVQELIGICRDAGFERYSLRAKQELSEG